MNSQSPEVDIFFNKAKKWQTEMRTLRNIILDYGVIGEGKLKEELKWGKPCYSFQGGNVVIIQGFKDYCALLFFKGALVDDPKGILVKTGENTRVGRQIRFTKKEDIVGMEAMLQTYIHKAVEVEKAGLKVEPEENPLVLPAEFLIKLNNNPCLKDAFENLTPGRKRAYQIYFSQPKRSQTREKRVEKYLPQILKGKGLNDQ